MRTIYALLVSGLVVLVGGASYAADLNLDRGRSHARGAGTFDQRLRVVEQVPYCGDCEAPIGRGYQAPPLCGGPGSHPRGNRHVYGCR
jgi:hypothetical protein